MPQGSKWGFGSDKRKGMGVENNSPGAGTYQIASTISDGPKFVMGSRLTNESSGMKLNPGPGQYDL